jgi:hypothetical protein
MYTKAVVWATSATPLPMWDPEGSGMVPVPNMVADFRDTQHHSSGGGAFVMTSWYKAGMSPSAVFILVIFQRPRQLCRISATKKLKVTALRHVIDIHTISLSHILPAMVLF